MGKYLILCPHPDDELHINFKILVENPTDAIIVVFTTGKAGIDENNNLIGSALVSERYNETIVGMSKLGINAEQIIFLGFSDGREDEKITIKQREQRIEDFILSIEFICSIHKPKMIFAPIPLELHIDHKYVGLALLKANILGEKKFSCYPRSIELPKEDFIQYLEEDIFDRRVHITETIYQTQKFLSKKLINNTYKYDKYWSSESVEKMLPVEEIYNIKDIFLFSSNPNYKYLFDDAVSKSHRVSKVLRKKYGFNNDPWGYTKRHYEKVRFNLLSNLLIENITLDQNIVDMGCGNGEFIKEILNKGYKNVIGIDQFTEPFKDVLKNNSSVKFIPYDFRTGLEYLLKNNIKVDLFMFNDSIYYIHISEYINIIEQLITIFPGSKILISGGSHFDIKEYLAYTLKYYSILSGKILKRSSTDNNELLSVLFEEK